MTVGSSDTAPSGLSSVTRYPRFELLLPSSTIGRKYVPPHAVIAVYLRQYSVSLCKTSTSNFSLRIDDPNQSTKHIAAKTPSFLRNMTTKVAGAPFETRGRYVLSALVLPVFGSSGCYHPLVSQSVNFNGFRSIFHFSVKDSSRSWTFWPYLLSLEDTVPQLVAILDSFSRSLVPKHLLQNIVSPTILAVFHDRWPAIQALTRTSNE